MIPFIGNNQQNVESTSVVARSWGVGMGNDCLIGKGFLFGVMKIF